jgi:acetoin utilization deacetylase AcuC-like enzyme
MKPFTSDPLGGNNAGRKSKVSYYFDEEFACFNVPADFMMKPLRIKLTDSLIKSYEMDTMLDNIQVNQDFVANVDLSSFHSDDYVDCLKNISVEKKALF